MTETSYERVCFRTEQGEEEVPLRNVKSGKLGYSFRCTQAGEKVQVKLTNGKVDTWSRAECAECFSEPL